MYYSYKVKDPNKGRRKPFRHWMMKLLPVLIIVFVFGMMIISAMFEMGGKEEENMTYGSEYEGFVIVDTFVSYDNNREQNAYFLVLENPNTYESDVIEVSESQLFEYNVGEEFHSYIE